MLSEALQDLETEKIGSIWIDALDLCILQDAPGRTGTETCEKRDCLETAAFQNCPILLHIMESFYAYFNLIYHFEPFRGVPLRARPPLL